jgi:hypothetical protein
MVNKTALLLVGLMAFNGMASAAPKNALKPEDIQNGKLSNKLKQTSGLSACKTRLERNLVIVNQVPRHV